MQTNRFINVKRLEGETSTDLGYQFVSVKLKDGQSFDPSVAFLHLPRTRPERALLDLRAFRQAARNRSHVLNSIGLPVLTSTSTKIYLMWH
jgi:hypothetical protein